MTFVCRPELRGDRNSTRQRIGCSCDVLVKVRVTERSGAKRQLPLIRCAVVPNQIATIHDERVVPALGVARISAVFRPFGRYDIAVGACGGVASKSTELTAEIF